MFADDAALVAHTEEDLQRLMDCFSKACEDFRLTISLKKTNVMNQDTENVPDITINNYQLEAVNEFTYLGSTITSDLSMESEINKRIGRAITTFAKLSARVWNNNKLTTKTKIGVYRACILSTLLYGSESWTLYSKQEKRLNKFHLRSLRRILGIKWTDFVTNNNVLNLANIPSMYTLLRQRRLRWLGHVRRMQDGRIPKDLLYGELAIGKRSRGRPQLRYKDVCKKDMRDLGMNIDDWEELATDRPKWRRQLHLNLQKGEEELQRISEQQRENRKNRQEAPPANTTFRCAQCGRDCRSRIGLHSHSRRCSNVN